MKYIDADKLIAEIERRKAIASAMLFPGQAQLCEDLLDFIDTLPEEKHSEDLERATKDYLKVLALTPYNNTPITNAQVVCEELLAFLKESCNYNPNKISAESSEDLEKAAEEYSENILAGGEDMFDAIADGFIAGAQWQKEQMCGTSGIPNTHCKDFEKEIIRYQREDMDRDTTVGDVARHFVQWQREQMMKDAVETTMVEGSLSNPTFVKRKIIIVKENEN